MARARNIKPGFFKNEAIAELPFEFRLLFIGLWTLADREGRLEDRPRRIRMELFPADNVDCEAGLAELARLGLIVRYEVEGNSYIDIPTFCQHQNPHPREAASAIPSFQGNTKAKPRHDQGDALDLSSPADVLNPDSLNPESLKETTPATSRDSQADSGQPAAGAVPSEVKPPPEVVAAVDALRVGAAVGTDDYGRAGELFAVLKANSCRGTPQHPQVIEWVRAGVTLETLRRAIAEARMSTDDQLNPAYLAPIVERILSGGGKANGKAQAWTSDERACEAKARELGLWPARSGESWNDLRGRIRAALVQRAEEGVQ